MTKSRIILFGKLKAFCHSQIIEVESEPQMSTQQLRETVARILKERNSSFSGVEELLSSRIANENRILAEGEPIGESREFSFLPPVCGG